MHRQIFKITFPKNMCQRAPWTSRYVHFTTSPFFFTQSAFKNQHRGNKKNPQLPYYWILKQCVQEIPLWVSFKRFKKEDALHVPHGHRNCGKRRYQYRVAQMMTLQPGWGGRKKRAGLAGTTAGGTGGGREVTKRKGRKDNRNKKGFTCTAQIDLFQVSMFQSSFFFF